MTRKIQAKWLDIRGGGRRKVKGRKWAKGGINEGRGRVPAPRPVAQRCFRNHHTMKNSRQLTCQRQRVHGQADTQVRTRRFAARAPVRCWVSRQRRRAARPPPYLPHCRYARETTKTESPRMPALPGPCALRSRAQQCSTQPARACCQRRRGFRRLLRKSRSECTTALQTRREPWSQRTQPHVACPRQQRIKARHNEGRVREGGSANTVKRSARGCCHQPATRHSSPPHSPRVRSKGSRTCSRSVPAVQQRAHHSAPDARGEEGSKRRGGSRRGQRRIARGAGHAVRMHQGAQHLHVHADCKRRRRLLLQGALRHGRRRKAGQHGMPHSVVQRRALAQHGRRHGGRAGRSGGSCSGRVHTRGQLTKRRFQCGSNVRRGEQGKGACKNAAPACRGNQLRQRRQGKLWPDRRRRGSRRVRARDSRSGGGGRRGGGNEA